MKIAYSCTLGLLKAFISLVTLMTPMVVELVAKLHLVMRELKKNQLICLVSPYHRILPLWLAARRFGLLPTSPSTPREDILVQGR